VVSGLLEADELAAATSLVEGVLDAGERDAALDLLAGLQEQGLVAEVRRIASSLAQDGYPGLLRDLRRR
jgi:hypothetical protein